MILFLKLIFYNEFYFLSQSKNLCVLIKQKNKSIKTKIIINIKNKNKNEL